MFLFFKSRHKEKKSKKTRKNANIILFCFLCCFLFFQNKSRPKQKSKKRLNPQLCREEGLLRVIVTLGELWKGVSVLWDNKITEKWVCYLWYYLCRAVCVLCEIITLQRSGCIICDDNFQSSGCVIWDIGTTLQSSGCVTCDDITI